MMRWITGFVADLRPDGRTWRDRRYYRRHINPWGLPPEGYLCPACLRFDPAGVPPSGICSRCEGTRGNSAG